MLVEVNRLIILSASVLVNGFFVSNPLALALYLLSVSFLCDASASADSESAGSQSNQNILLFHYGFFHLQSLNSILIFMLSFGHDKSPLDVVIILYQGGFCLMSVFTGSVQKGYGTN